MRILDIWGTALGDLKGRALAEAILESEGRVIGAEVEGVTSGVPCGYGSAVSNGEMSAAFGADLIFVNAGVPFLDKPVIPELESLTHVPCGFQGLSRYLGRPCGPILEPDLPYVPEPIRASEETVNKAVESGAAFIILSANPCRGPIGHKEIIESVKTVRRASGDILVIAGKMHHSGMWETYTPDAARAYMEAGADGSIIPVPGTVPGVTERMAADYAGEIHKNGGLVLSAITTSQEGSDRETIRQLALSAKRTGADIHHISTAGYPLGSPPPENLYTYSVAVRGVRHTWNRMAWNLRNHWESL